MWSTIILLYLASISFAYVSIKTLLKRKKKIDADDLHLLTFLMFVPVFNVVGSLMLHIIIMVNYIADILKERAEKRKLTKQKSFLEIFFGVQKTEGYIRDQYTYEKKKMRR